MNEFRMNASMCSPPSMDGIRKDWWWFGAFNDSNVLFGIWRVVVVRMWFVGMNEDVDV